MRDDGSMYIVTNREVDPDASGFDMFGKDPNARGPNELRIAKVRKAGKKWQIEVLPDNVTRKEKGETIVEPASRMAARTIFRRLADQPRTGPRKDLLFFVHGFNNDVEAVVERAWDLQRSYDLEVVAFTWPANGGGVRGAASYKSDKRDARASIGALDRVLEKMREYLAEERSRSLAKIEEKIASKGAGRGEAHEELLARLSHRDCPFHISLLLHSMGNYLFKNLLSSSIYNGRELTFDNVVMAAADTNNKNHREWVDMIQARNRVYVTLNERDSALAASRIKGGEEQLARLGHYPYNLDSRQTVYVDFTGAPQVVDSHAYFEGTPARNKNVHRFFKEALHGETAETRLTYDASRNLHSIR